MREAIIDAESVWARIDVRGPDECWEWTGARNGTGYGTVTISGKTYTAHRVAAYSRGLVGTPAAPTDRRGSGFVLHQCDNRLCCNPAHMRVGTYAENQREAYARSRRTAFKGATHANAKLTPAVAEFVRDAYATGLFSQSTLGALCGVSQRCISLVTRGETYART